MLIFSMLKSSFHFCADDDDKDDVDKPSVD